MDGKMLAGAIVLCMCCGCAKPVQSVSGTKMLTVGNLQTDENGNTSEQLSIQNKIQVESDPDKTWYFYVISPFDRQIVMSSTVKGKITSSNKRLTPRTLTQGSSMSFNVGGSSYFTNEMPAEDGTYGSSAEYIYWKDHKGRNRRHYLLAGQIIHVVDQKMEMSELLGDD